MPCNCCCDECSGECCGTDFPGVQGECCDGEWRVGPGVCCEGQWHAEPGVCCGGYWHAAEETGGCCGDVWYSGTGECCGGSWHSEAGECCGGVWHTDTGDCCLGQWFANGECPEGYVRFNQTHPITGQYTCCFCVPQPVVDDGQGPDDVKWCCDFQGVHPATDPPINPPPGDYDWPYGPGGTECVAGCCVDNVCYTTYPSRCLNVGGTVVPGGCVAEGCPAACCTEDSTGVVSCNTQGTETCTGSYEFVACGDACKGECCINGESFGQTTQAGCYTLALAMGRTAAEVGWSGVGSTACQPVNSCREPFDEDCCETAQSTGYGLTFSPPRFQRTPIPFDTFRVTVTGETDSRILIHGIPVGVNATPMKRCPFQVTFLVCYGDFNIEPVPCGSRFASLDVKVCWEQVHTDVEELMFSGCDGLTIHLGHCRYGCETTLVYDRGDARSSDSSLITHGNATIEARSGQVELSGGLTPAITFRPNNSLCPSPRILTLSGTSSSDNKISGVIQEVPEGFGYTQVRKVGPGAWWLSNQGNAFRDHLRVREGTLVVGGAVLFQYGYPTVVGIRDVVLGDGGSTPTLLLTAEFEKRIWIRRTPTAVIGALQDATMQLGSVGILEGVGELAIRAAPSHTLTIGAIGNFVVGNIAGPGTMLSPVQIDPPPAPKTPYGSVNPTFSFGSDGWGGTVVCPRYTPRDSPINVRAGTLVLGWEVGGPQSVFPTLWPLSPVTVGDDYGPVALVINCGAYLNGGIPYQGLYRLFFAGQNNVVTGGQLWMVSDAFGLAFETGEAAITVSGAGHAIDSDVLLGVDSEVLINDSGHLSISGAVSGPHYLTKRGNGSLQLSGTLSFSGGLRMAGGSVVLTQFISNPGLLDSVIVEPTALTAAFSGTPASGTQYVLLPCATQTVTGAAWSGTVTLTGTGATASYNSSTSTLTIL